MNLFTQFQRLLPQRPLQIGTVVAIDNGVATIEVAGGGLVVARGDAGTGDRVFFRDGLIEAQASELPFVEYDI